MAEHGLPETGVCDLSTRGRRTGQWRRVEIWYVVVDGQVVLTGTPGARHWLANLRADPAAVLHLRDPDEDLPVLASEVTDAGARRRCAEEAWRLQPWYAEQPFSIEQWAECAPMVVLTPQLPGTRDRRRADDR